MKYIHRFLYYTAVRIEWIIILLLSGSANKRPNKLKHTQFFFIILLTQFINPWIYTLVTFGVCIILKVCAFAQYDHTLFMCRWLLPLFSRCSQIDGLRDYYCHVCSSSREFYDGYVLFLHQCVQVNRRDSSTSSFALYVYINPSRR